jgi:hypothetical protein
LQSYDLSLRLSNVEFVQLSFQLDWAIHWLSCFTRAMLSYHLCIAEDF